MGQITSKLPLRLLSKKTTDDYRKELESMNKEILDLEQKKIVLHHHYNIVVELVLTYSRILYVLVALVFFFTTLPTSFLEYVFFCGPLVIFYGLVWCFKAAVKWYYENEVKRCSGKVKDLKVKKKNILARVEETAQYKDAKEILATYGPDKAVVDKVAVEKILQRSSPNKKNQYLDNVMSYVLGEEKKNSLICKYCKCHNGMALEEECDFMAFRCCRCFYMNYPRKRKSSEENDQTKSPEVH